MDAKLYIRTILYNVISLLAIVVFIGGFYINFESLSGRGLVFLAVFLGHKKTFWFILWPLVASVAITLANQYSMNKFINMQLNIHLIANNINVDYDVDTGATKENEIYFPLIRELPYGGSRSVSYDTNKTGNFDDLGFSYAIDDYKSQASYKSGNDSHTIYSISGQIYNFIYSNVLTNSPIIITSKDFHSHVSFQGYSIFSPLFIQNLENMKVTEDSGLLIATSLDYDITKLYALDLTGDVFKTEFYIVINNNHVSVLSSLDKFKIKVPFFITKGMLEKLEDDQKTNAFKFNTFLYDLAFVFKGLK